jgi:cytoskeletal protein RodZ
MREFQDKRKVRRVLYSKTVLVVLFILIVLLFRGTWNVYVKAKESKHQSEISKQELATVQARHNFLNKEIEHLDTAIGKEDEIRQNFQVAKEGEEIAVIVEATSTVNTEVEEQGALKKVWNKFIHIFR